MAASKGYIVAAALDFGTTFSGYAFSFFHDFKEDPLKIKVNALWQSSSRSLMSYKTPTCLLLDENKEFVAFGYEAEDVYADKALEGKKDEFFYFYRFKMNLHNNKVRLYFAFCLILFQNILENCRVYRFEIYFVSIFFSNVAVI